MNRKIYIGYKTRVAFYLVLSFLMALIIVILVKSSIIYEDKSEVVKYSEYNSASYKINLLKNTHYDTDYLDESMKVDKYIARLINTIDINFDYTLSVDCESDVDFIYGIYGVLSIRDSEDKSTYKEEDVIFKKDQLVTMSSKKQQKIHDSAHVNYKEFNSTVNEYRTKNGVSVISELKVYMRVTKISRDNNTKFDSETSDIVVVLPMALNSFNIQKVYTPSISGENIKGDTEVYVKKGNIVTSVLLGILLIYCVIRLIKLFAVGQTKKSNFDKTVDRLLKEYDRLIVETTSSPDFKKCNIIKINKFEELLDVRDNLKLPIMHYIVSKHIKAYFYIKNYKDVYLVTLKAVDMED